MAVSDALSKILADAEQVTAIADSIAACNHISKLPGSTAGAASSSAGRELLSMLQPEGGSEPDLKQT